MLRARKARGSEREKGSHRPRYDPCVFGVWSALLTILIPVKSPEFYSLPCTETLDKELGTLRPQGVWDKDRVREWRSVRIWSGADGKDDIVGRFFVIMGDKNAEDGVLPHLRKYKTRVVFAGEKIKPRSIRRLTNCFRNYRRPLLRCVLSGLRSASRLFRGISPQLEMRIKLTFWLTSTTLTGRTLECDCRGSGGRRHSSMRAENRCTTIRSFLLSTPCITTQNQMPCGTHTWGPS